MATNSEGDRVVVVLSSWRVRGPGIHHAIMQPRHYEEWPQLRDTEQWASPLDGWFSRISFVFTCILLKNILSFT